MPESKYEALFSSMLRIAGITDYKREHRFDAVRKWRFDFAWPDKMIAAECDGYTWGIHGGRHSRTSDYEKRNAATRAGWRVFYFDGELVKSGKALALMIEVLRDECTCLSYEIGSGRIPDNSRCKVHGKGKCR